MDGLQSTRNAQDYDTANRNIQNAARLADRIEKCQQLGYVPASVPIIR
jgi:hypothetical protein